MFNKYNTIVNIIIFLVYLLVIGLSFQEIPIIIVTLVFTIVTTILNIYILTSSTSGFNDYPLLIVTNTLYFIQIILSIILTYLMFIPFTISLLVQTILLAIHLILFLFLRSAKNEIEKTEEHYKGYTDTHTNFQKFTETLLIKNKNQNIKEDLEKLNEKLKYSNPTSSIQTKGIDEEILNKLKTLDDTINTAPDNEVKNLINYLIDLIEQRDIQLKK